MQNRFWNTMDNINHFMGRTVRHGNGNIRVGIVSIAFIAMFLYPFYNM